MTQPETFLERPECFARYLNSAVYLSIRRVLVSNSANQVSEGVSILQSMPLHLFPQRVARALTAVVVVGKGAQFWLHLFAVLNKLQPQETDQ